MSKNSSYQKVRAILAVLCVTLGSACASGPNGGPSDAPVVANSRVAWEDGLRAVDTGEAMLMQGEKRLALGRQQVREGEAKIREGRERASQTKFEYEQAAMAAGEFATQNRQAQANTLRAIGMRWEAANQEIKDGNKLIATGNANINRGEAEISDGQKLMETGSVLMRNAQRSRLGLQLLPPPES